MIILGFILFFIFMLYVSLKDNASYQYNDYSKKRAVKVIMDLFYALKHIKGTPSLKDLIQLAKRIKNDTL